MGLGRGRPGRPGGPALSRRRLPRRLAARFPAVRRAPLPRLQCKDRRARLPAGTGAPVPCRARRRDRQLPRVAGRRARGRVDRVRRRVDRRRHPGPGGTHGRKGERAPAGRAPWPRDARQFAEAVRDYLPPGQDPAAPLVSPLYADWSGLPAVHIEVGSTERLIDDARRLIDRARLAGVPATLDVTEGAVHAFPATALETPEAEAAIERIAYHLIADLGAPDSAAGLSRSAGHG